MFGFFNVLLPLPLGEGWSEDTQKNYSFEA